MDQNLIVLRAIASRTRLSILSVLTKTRIPVRVGEIARTLGMTHSAISHQLAILSSAGVIAGRRKGRFEMYSFTKTNEGILARKLLKVINK